MSDANRVLWSEGLFLRTQHFQQQDRFFEAMARGTLQAGRLHTFGFRSLALEPGAARGRPGGDPVGARHLPGRHARSPSPRRWTRRAPLAITADAADGAVLLALPLEPPGGASFDPAHAEPTGARYRGRIERVRDAVQGGADPEEIEIARPQALLLAPGRAVGGYTALPVAEITGLRADGGVALRRRLPAAGARHRRGAPGTRSSCRR